LRGFQKAPIAHLKGVALIQVAKSVGKKLSGGNGFREKSLGDRVRRHLADR